jgi:hypothetical protein
MTSPTLVVDPSDMACRVERATYGLYGVAANGLTISVCMYYMLYVKNRGGIVGGGGTIKCNS